MSLFWQTFRAEMVKQHANSFSGRAVFFSLLLWPVLTFFTAYYSMKPYRTGQGSALSDVIPNGQIALFLLSGFLVFQLFWTVVQAAWTFEWERHGGTLEMIYLTPSSKMAFLFGRSMYALFTGIWMFFAFSIITFFVVADVKHILLLYLFVALFLACIAALIWGAFLCSISLFSRDSGYLYYIFQEPMNLFGGVRIPPAVFPLWAKVFSFFFPVSYNLYLVRQAISGLVNGMWWFMVVVSLLFNLLFIWLTKILLVKAERHARIQGNWTLF